MKNETTERLISALPLAALLVMTTLWGVCKWIPSSGGYEMVLYHPHVILAIVTLLTTAMLIPLSFTRCRLDRIGGICASFLPLASLLNTILFSEGVSIPAVMCAGIWMNAWSIAAAIRHGSRKGLKIFLCIFSGIGVLGYLAVLLVVLHAHISIQMSNEVVRSAVSPNGALIVEEWGEEGAVDNSIHIRENSEEINVLIGRFRSESEPVYHPFVGSAAIEELGWADNDTISIRYKGHDEETLIDIE